MAVGYGQLQVYDPWIVENDDKKVSLTTNEQLINKPSNFLIEVEVPLPLNAGCQIDITLPETLRLGAEMDRVIIGGMFGSVRDADISLDASRNLIHIDNACRTYRQNAAKASFEIE